MTGTKKIDPIGKDVYVLYVEKVVNGDNKNRYKYFKNGTIIAKGTADLLEAEKIYKSDAPAIFYINDLDVISDESEVRG